MTASAAEIDLVWCPFPDRSSAETAARAVVEEGLAACVNILSPVTSVYRWEGAAEQATEVPLLCKTAAGQGAALAARLAELHNYDLPAIVWWPSHCGRSLAQWAAAA